MRIRTIKPEFFTHEALFAAEQETHLPLRVAFIGLWCAADREGRFKWEARRLGVQILPYDLIDFSRVLDALTTRGFIVKYRVENEDYGLVPSFVRHQVINNREKASDLPEPLKDNDSDACGTREPRVDHASKAEGKGMDPPLPPKGGASAETGDDWDGPDPKQNPNPPLNPTPEKPPLCTIEQAIMFGASQKISERACRHWWHTRNAAGWTRGSASGHARRITGWQSDLTTAASWAEEEAHKSAGAAKANDGSQNTMIIAGRAFKI